MANYANFSKATYAQGLTLDRDIRDALNRVIARDMDGSGSLLRGVTLDAGSSDVSPVSGFNNVDLLTFQLPPGGGTVDLSTLSASTLAKLDILRFLGDGPATLNASTFTGVVLLGDGSDNVVGLQALAVQAGAGNDTVTTGAYNDTISGGLGNDSISSGGGNDLVIGGEGNDTINAGSGSDTVRAGAGDDLVYAGGNHDTVFGGAGNDSIYGGNGNDRLFGGTGNDILEGGAGDDIIYTGSGSDTVQGGAGYDNIIVDNSAAGDVVTIDGGSESDILDLSKLVITQATLTGSLLQVTLDTGAELNVTNVEQFIYDNNGAAPGGAITVGLTQFLADGDF